MIFVNKTIIEQLRGIYNENSPDSYHTQYIHKIGFLFIHNIPDLKVYRHTSNRGTETGNSTPQNRKLPGALYTRAFIK